MLAYPAPGASDRDYAALKVLNAHLGAGMSSPLFQSVREEGGLAYEVSSFYPSRRLASALVVYAGTDPANVDQAHKKVLRTVQDLLEKPPSGEALDDAKRYIRGHYMMDHQTNGKLAWYLGWWEVLGRGHGHDAAYLKEIDAVTAEDVRRSAERLFAQPPVTVKIRSKK
jgi:zinc protease